MYGQLRNESNVQRQSKKGFLWKRDCAWTAHRAARSQPVQILLLCTLKTFLTSNILKSQRYLIGKIWNKLIKAYLFVAASE